MTHAASPAMMAHPLPKAAALATALRAPGPSYALLAGCLLGPAVLFYLVAPLGYEHDQRDIWHHVAVLRELIAHPFAPSNPHLPTEEPSRYYGPIAVLGALAARAAGLDAVALLGLFGASSCVGLAVLVRAFASRFYADPFAPHVLLGVLLLGWGMQHGFTGQYSLAAFAFGAGYPAAQAFVLGIGLWTAILRTLDRRARPALHLIGLVALTSVLVLTHQLSGAIMLAGGGSFALFAGRATLRRRAAVVAALGAGVLAAFTWPYFDIWTVTTSSSDPQWRSEVVVMLDSPSYQLRLAAFALGVGALGLAVSRGAVRRSIALPLAVLSAAWVMLTVLGHPVAHRLSAGAMLYWHLASVAAILAVARGALMPSWRRVLLLAIALFGVFGAMQVATVRAYEAKTRNGQDGLLRVAAEMRADVPADRVAFASLRIVYPYQSTGARVVSIPRPEPSSASLPARQAATEAFFAAGTDQAGRRALAAEWGASHAVFRVGDLPDDVAAQIERMGPVRRYDLGVTLVRIAP